MKCEVSWKGMGWVIRDGDKMNYILTGYAGEEWLEGGGRMRKLKFGGAINLIWWKMEMSHDLEVCCCFWWRAGVRLGDGVGGWCHKPYHRR